MMTSKRTLVQDCSSDSFFISQQLKTIKDNLFLLVKNVPKWFKKLFGGTDLQAGFLMGGLFGEEAGGEGLLHAGGDKDTAFTVLR